MTPSDTTREATARDTCRIFAAAYEPPRSFVGMVLLWAAMMWAVVILAIAVFA